MMTKARLQRNSKKLLRAGALALSLALTCAFADDHWPLAPEFYSDKTSDWLNSKPAKMADFRGKVVLLDVWTYGCHNCYRSIPWLLSLEESFAGESFTIVGIHTPEFRHERDPRNVKRKLAEFGITHPVVLDNGFKQWRRLKNRYWPTFYLIDKQGRIRSKFIGETHRGDKRAKAIEKAIANLLTESSNDKGADEGAGAKQPSESVPAKSSPEKNADTRKKTSPLPAIEAD